MPVNLAEVARQVIARLKPLADAKAVTLRHEGQLVMVNGSPERLALVLSNLVENAIHHGKSAGTVVVRTWNENGEARASVVDDGPGIAAEDLPHVFERFYRAEKSRTGSGGRYGLGLAICRGLVDAEGGTITVESKPGYGAVFTVAMPSASGIGR